MSQSDVSCTKTQHIDPAAAHSWNALPRVQCLTIGQPHHQWRDVFKELNMQKQCITDNFYKYMSVIISTSQKQTITLETYSVNSVKESWFSGSVLVWP